MGSERALLILAVAGIACGGKAVIDGEGAAGGATSAGGAGQGGAVVTGPVTVSGPTSSAATGVTCAELGERLEAAIREAIRCAPSLPVVQCDGSAVVYDACSCPLIANENQREAIEEALRAHDELVAAGCGLDCGGCLPLGIGECQGDDDRGQCASGDL